MVEYMCAGEVWTWVRGSLNVCRGSLEVGEGSLEVGEGKSGRG